MERTELAFIASADEFGNATKMKNALERQGIPIVIMAKRNHNGYWLFTYPHYEARARRIRNHSA